MVTGIENFVLNFFEINWKHAVNLKEQNIDLSFDNFSNSINNLLDKYESLKNNGLD